MDTSVLYITYDGLLDPLGRSQVQPYVRGLARRGVSMTVISFEKQERAGRNTVDQLRQSLTRDGVDWRPMRYHRRPTLPATAWDILQGVRLARRLARGKNIGIVHARSYIAGIIALAVKRHMGARFLFDMRGFWPDERVEGGSWKKGGMLYKTFKQVERSLLRAADGIVTLTRRGADIVQREMLPSVREDSPPLAVIPTCTDLEKFRQSGGRQRTESGVRMVYLGSLGSWYMLEPMLEFFAVLRKTAPGSTFRILTGSPPGEVRQTAEKLGLDSDTMAALSVESVPHERVPEELASADCTILFIRPTFSKQASCATKFGESLACGLPVVINSGVGDHDTHLRGRDAGVVLEKLDRTAYEQAAADLLALLRDPETGSRCRGLAGEKFSLDGAVESYLELYGTMLAGEGR